MLFRPLDWSPPAGTTYLKQAVPGRDGLLTVTFGSNYRTQFVHDTSPDVIIPTFLWQAMWPACRTGNRHSSRTRESAGLRGNQWP